MKFKGFIIGMAITAGIVGAFDAGIILAKNLENNRYAQQIEIKDESLANSIEELNKLKQELKEALNNNATSQETINNLETQIAELEEKIKQYEEMQNDSALADFIMNNENITAMKLGNKTYLSAINAEGLYCLDDTGFSKVYDEGTAWVNYCYNQDSSLLFLGSGTGGILLINQNGDISKFSNIGDSVAVFYENEDSMLIVINSSEGSNYYIFDKSTYEKTNTNINFNTFSGFSNLNDNLIKISSYEQEGLYIIDMNEKSVELVYETGSAWECYSSEKDTYILMDNSNTLLCYDGISKTVTDTYNDGLMYHIDMQDENSITFKSADNTVTLTFSYATKTFEKQNSFESIIDQVKQGTKTTLTYADFEGVTEIPDNAFENCSALTSVEIPNTITSIGSSAFKSCSSLTNLTFQENSTLTEINNSAFAYCSNLTTVTIPASVTGIYISAFDQCTNLAEITFEEGSQLQALGNGAIRDTKITEITLPATLNNFQGLAHNDYLQTVTFTSNVILSGNLKKSGTFDDCPALTTIYVPNSALEEFKTTLSNYTDLFVGF